MWRGLLLGLIVASVFLIQACSEKPVPEVAVAIPEPVIIDPYAMAAALFEKTGYQLGALPNEKFEGLAPICSPKMRYGEAADAKIAMLYCINGKPAGSGRVQFMVNFSTPADGNKVWKISLGLPGNAAQNANFLSELTAEFGAPRVLDNPHTLSWMKGKVYLRVREDRFGLQFELWDRSQS